MGLFDSFQGNNYAGGMQNLLQPGQTMQNYLGQLQQMLPQMQQAQQAPQQPQNSFGPYNAPLQQPQAQPPQQQPQTTFTPYNAPPQQAQNSFGPYNVPSAPAAQAGGTSQGLTRANMILPPRMGQ